MLGWTSAIASYGAYLIPSFVSIAIADNNTGIFFYCMGGFYAICFVLNFWYYARAGAEAKC